MPQEISVIGNLASDPELRFTQGGIAVANFSLADTPRVKDGNDWKDGDTIWWRVSAWRDLAENAMESLRKGDRVIVLGTPKQTNWDKDGQKFSRIELTANEIGPSLKWATARMTKTSKNSSGGGGGSNWDKGASGSGFSGQDDEPPF